MRQQKYKCSSFEAGFVMCVMQFPEEQNKCCYERIWCNRKYAE